MENNQTDNDQTDDNLTVENSTNANQSPKNNQPDPDKLIDSYILNFTKDDPHGYVSYQKLLEPMFTMQAECKQPFESCSKTYMLKDLIISVSKTNTHKTTLTRSAHNASAVGNDYILVLFYRDIPIRIKTRKGEKAVAPEQIVVADLAKSFEIHTSYIDVVSLNFSRSRLSKLMPITDHLHGAVFTDGPYKELLVSYMKTLADVAGEIKVKNEVNITETIMHLVANCVQQTITKKPFKVSTNRNVTLLKLKQAIDAQIEDPDLCAKTLVEEFHVSRANIYRLFEPLGGVAKYIKSRKLDFAFTELARSSDKIPNISALAYRLGFNHPATFTRAFIEKFEIKPSEVRARAGKKEKQELPWNYEIDLEQYKEEK